ncbi:DNA polymerase/3'-5' exonuclease PolX [Algoriphagus marinus]|uniref:DNA polymerase/3'-5' exonuclease PolX n=1 Tax=Algoriphagus marinus TaxID=1925762 RepID=UPI00094B8324|nr:DNA polymerase/3'-5' exonuclease PolX [Algoriphagus marinus]
MDHKTLLKKLKLAIQLMELHDENSFKIRSYQSALTSLERGDQDIMDLSTEELSKIPGVGKSILEAISQLKEQETFTALQDLLEKTPEGILEILQIKGLGPKKVKVIWEELGVTSTHELMEACQSGKVAKLKGFGEKTQDTIIQNLEFKASNQGKWLYADIEETIEKFTSELERIYPSALIAIVGDFARKMEIISEGEFLIGLDSLFGGKEKLKSLETVVWDMSQSGPFSWKGTLTELNLKMTIHFTTKKDFLWKKLSLIAAPSHLAELVDEKENISEKLAKRNYNSEEEFFQVNELQFIPAEMREGLGEVALAKANAIPELLEERDLKGILHNHSTYSDGKHSLRQMAEHCKALGFEYLGISDHSRTAFYAGGLEIEKVLKQHAEIDALNKEMAPFRIFKGIESDILADGKLDYPDDILAKFDFVVASIHSILNMEIKKATHRLITAIENPYTTILGHPTGRLLLRRAGYPINHKAIIDACAANDVVIEINANPWRLDLDWRWIHYAMEQNVKLSINPDAHEMDGYDDMKYGVLIGRKGGLTKAMTLNTLSVDEIANYFEKRKKQKIT